MTLCIHHPCEHQNTDTDQMCQACGKPLRIHHQFRPLNQIGSGGFGRTLHRFYRGFMALKPGWKNYGKR